MKLQIPLIIIALSCCCAAAVGQTAWFAADTLSEVRKDGIALRFPWAGGLNAVQYGKIDLDLDGVEDLVAFDRSTSKVSTFLADPVLKTFQYRPEYESLFPLVTNWMALVDFDNDGKKELFTHVSYGVTVFRQEQDGAGGWRWVNIKNYLTATGLSGNSVNLYVAASDFPALVDIDGDGDMDIITFEAGGDFLELNQNMSMERYGVPDSLEFVRNGACWGDFRKHTCGDFQFGVDCGVKPDLDNARVMHAGNAILMHDFNGDGIKDMLLGNVDCENLNLVYNDAPGLVGNYSSFRSSYPENNPAEMSVFPAGFMEDVDFDGVKDLLVSPNVYGNDNLMMDFISSGWYYHNAGTDNQPDFRLRQKNFLQSEMVDVGENAAASFFDVDGDGRVDMLVGNRGRYNGTDFRGSLWFYKNIGTAENPVYELDTDDFLGLAGLMGHTDLQPQWLDFNGDGRVDLGLTSIYNRRLWFHYFPNQGGDRGAQLSSALKVEISLPSALSVSDRVHFADFDYDGDPDLIVGGVLGNISFYENTGSAASPNFVLRDAALGGMGPSFARRYLSLAVADLDLDGRNDIVTVDQNGKINILYQGEWGNWTKTDTAVILNSLTGKVFSPFLGTRLHITVGDVNNDKKPDIAVGTAGGGLYLFRNILPVEVTGNEPGDQFYVYPNPTGSTFFIKSTVSATFDVFDLLGNRVHSGIVSAGIDTPVSTASWAGGVYIVRLSDAAGTRIKKVVVF